MNRYLLNIAYSGKPFLGAQTLLSRSKPELSDPHTVQGQIEIALKLLHPSNVPCTILSSRTDSGVHAFHSTLHVDLTRNNGEKYDPYYISLTINKYFNKNDVPIRVLKTYLVPNTFSCTHAVSRTYLYRLAVIKSNQLHESTLLSHVPIEELGRSLFIRTNAFDVGKMRETAKLFLGTHDFRTFMSKCEQIPQKPTRKNMFKLEILDADPLFYSKYSWPSCVLDDISRYTFYDIYVQASGFLHKQVRRTVASLIAVGQGKVTSKDIKFMLEIPSRHSWNPCIKTVPPHGLFLCHVEYSKRDQQTFKETLEDCGLPYGTTERDLERFFRGYGRMRDVLIKNGYGFVEFDDHRDADDAVYELNGKKLLGERVTVERARGTPRGRDQWSGRTDHRSHERYGPPTRTNHRLIVENLSSRISWQDLKDYMRQAGEVTYADAHKQHRNEGVVEFASYSDLKNAIEKLDDTELNGRRIRLVEDKSSRRSKRSGSYSSRSRSRSRSVKKSRSRSRRSSRSKSKSRSRSPAENNRRSKSRSRSVSRKKSVDRSRSNSRKKSVDERSKSRSQSRSDNKRSKSREPSKERSRSRSVSKGRSKSRSRSRSEDN